MPRQTCTTCNERKSIDLFPKDSRCARGYAFRCKDCKAAEVKPKVRCPNCNKTCAEADLANHMKTKICINVDADWKHPMKSKDRFKYNETRYVTCPCKHEQCQGKIMESTAYRHMKYGIARRKAVDATGPFSVTWIDSDYDSERDL